MPVLLTRLPSLLAFGFASPLLLWGLALGGIPVVIHLLHKRRYREMPWAAMQFLIAAARKNSRRIRLEQLLLLAVRVLILLLLALALAQPYVESFGTYFQADVPMHRVIVVDASFSMLHASGGKSRFEQAMNVARRIVGAGRQGDSYQLLRIASSEPRAVISEPAFQAGQVARELEQLPLSSERGDVAATLRELKTALEQAPTGRRKEVYLLTDLQRSNWRPESGPDSAMIRQTLADIAELTVIDLAQSDAPNIAVVDIAVQEPLAMVEHPVRLLATVQNFGSARLSGQRVELRIDGRLADVQTVDLPPVSQARVEFTTTFPNSGRFKLEVRIEDDALPVDDRRWLALAVKDELSVLLVNGRPAGKPEDNATWFLQQALAPSSDGRAGIMRPRVITEGELAGIELSRYECVFLANVGRFTPREVEILTSYVEGGGTVVFSLGDQIRAENYNELLHRDGKGLLPARIGNRVGNARTPEKTFEFDTADLNHPIVAPFRGNLGAGLETDFTLEYFETNVPVDAQARVALRFTTGDPAIIDAPAGRGRVMLITTSVDSRWGPWPIQRSFLPIVHEMVRHGLSGRSSERQRLVGEPLVLGIPARSDVRATVELPDRTTTTAAVTESAGGAELSFGPTTLPGIYEIEIGPPLGRSELFAVNVDPRESNLAHLDESEFRSDVLPDSDFEYRLDWEDEARATDIAVARRGGLTRWLLLGVLGLLLVEVALAWNFVAGLLALYTLIALAFIRQGWAWNSTAGLLLALVLGGTLLAVALLKRRALAHPQ